MVHIPVPNPGKKVAREISNVALVVIKGPGLLSIISAAAVLTAILAIPIIGTWCSVFALILASSVYGEIIRRVSRGPSEVPDPSWKSTLIPRTVPTLIVCVLMALGIVFPLWILNAGLRRSPHLDWVGRSILTSTGILLPLLMLVTYGKDAGRPLGFRGCYERLCRHPLATVLAIVVVPTIVSLLEFSLGLIFYAAGSLPFLALDFMPMPHIPSAPVMVLDIPYYDGADYRSYPDENFIDGYFDGLKHGYSFVGAIPASLSNETRAGINTLVHGLEPLKYYFARVLIVFVINFFVLAAFAIQARWLGAIPALDRKEST